MIHLDEPARAIAAALQRVLEAKDDPAKIKEALDRLWGEAQEYFNEIYNDYRGYRDD